jgi:methionyl-tRNA formyltransferase
LRVAFFGSSRFSCLVLRRLLESVHEVACVVTQPDQPAGRSMVLTPTPVCADALGAAVPILKPERLRGNAEIVEQLRKYELDALVVASYGQIVPKQILSLIPWPLNVHPSLLPRLRGASPIRTALLQGLQRTGCCIMRMTPRLDDGDVLLREEYAIPHDYNYEQLETDLGELGGRLAVEALNACANETVRLDPQDNAQATYCTTYTRDDSWIDWRRGATELYNFIRAWDPDLGAQTVLNGRKLKVWRAAVAEGQGAPGKVLSAERKLLTVACGKGALSLLVLQPENKRRMSIGEFLAGNRVESGEIFDSPS